MPVLFESKKGPKAEKARPEKLVKKKEAVKAVDRKAQATKAKEPIADKSSKLAPLLAYAARPTNIFFETQDDDEEILLVLRRHLATNVPWIVLTFLGFLAPLVFYPIFFNLLFPSVPAAYKVIILAVWYLGMGTFAFTDFIIWYFNVHIITNKRVVDIDFTSLTVKQLTSAELEQIQDVSYRQVGVIRSVFNYGDVHIQTAASQQDIVFEGVPKPVSVVNTLEELVEDINN